MGARDRDRDRDKLKLSFWGDLIRSSPNGFAGKLEEELASRSVFSFSFLEIASRSLKFKHDGVNVDAEAEPRWRLLRF